MKITVIKPQNSIHDKKIKIAIKWVAQYIINFNKRDRM